MSLKLREAVSLARVTQPVSGGARAHVALPVLPAWSPWPQCGRRCLDLPALQSPQPTRHLFRYEVALAIFLVEIPKHLGVIFCLVSQQAFLKILFYMYSVYVILQKRSSIF